MSREALFALYRGDEFVDVGTRKELAARLGVTASYIQYMSTPVYRERIRGHEDTRLMAYRVEEEEE